MNDHGTLVPAFEDKKRAGRVSSRNVASMRPRWRWKRPVGPVILDSAWRDRSRWSGPRTWFRRALRAAPAHRTVAVPAGDTGL